MVPSYGKYFTTLPFGISGPPIKFREQPFLGDVCHKRTLLRRHLTNQLTIKASLVDRWPFGTAFVILRIRHGVALPVALVLLMMGVFCLFVALTM